MQPTNTDKTFFIIDVQYVVCILKSYLTSVN